MSVGTNVSSERGHMASAHAQRPATHAPAAGRKTAGPPGRSNTWRYSDSLVMASAALPATTQLADPATTASSSNQRNPKSSMHSGKSGLMTIYPGITAPGMYALSARLLLYVFVFETVPTPATYEVLDTGWVPRM